MNNSIDISIFQNHRKWLQTLGNEGQKLVLDEVDLSSINSVEEIYEQSYLTDCIFDNRNLKNYSFYLSKLYSTSFKNCCLENIDFTRADLSYVDFSNVALSDVKFSKCDCIETVFSNFCILNSNMQNLWDARKFNILTPKCRCPNCTFLTDGINTLIHD